MGHGQLNIQFDLLTISRSEISTTGMSSPLNASTSEAYELLVSLLSQCPQTIEILPGDGSAWTPTLAGPPDDSPSFAPFLFVEGNLGIPQKILYNVYLHAIGAFKSARGCMSTRPAIVTVQRNDHYFSSIRILGASSSILLLANPSHQTALNSRKYLVQIGLIDPRAELRFMAALLSSQHYVKHAELWYHRRWLLGSTWDTRGSDVADVEPSPHLQFTSLEVFQQELALASRASELYPRNYFAWTHRLICIRALLSNYLTGTDAVGFVPTFRNEIVAIKGWIDCHVSDYSAIHAILSLSQAALQSGDLLLMDIIIEQDLLDHATFLVQEYPSHEALWMYIRMALSLLDMQQTRRAQQFVEQIVQPLAHMQYLGTGTKDDLVKASQYAKEFLNRRVGFRSSIMNYA